MIIIVKKQEEKCYKFKGIFKNSIFDNWIQQGSYYSSIILFAKCVKNTVNIVVACTIRSKLTFQHFNYTFIPSFNTLLQLHLRYHITMEISLAECNKLKDFTVPLFSYICDPSDTLHCIIDPPTQIRHVVLTFHYLLYATAIHPLLRIRGESLRHRFNFRGVSPLFRILRFSFFYGPLRCQK